MEKYRKILFSFVKLFCSAMMIISLAVAISVYPAYSFFDIFEEIDTVKTVEINSVFLFSACLSRLLVSLAEKRLPKIAVIELTFGIFAFSAAFFTRRVGGFSLSGYIFSYICLLVSPYVLSEIISFEAGNRRKKLRSILFKIFGILFMVFGVLFVLIALTKPILLAFAAIRFLTFPIALTGAISVCFGYLCGKIRRFSSLFVRVLTLSFPIFIFVTSKEYFFTDIVRYIISFAITAVAVICTADYTVNRKNKSAEDQA